MGAGVLKLVLSLSFSHTGHWSSAWHLMAKNSLRIWKKELLLYIKMGVGYKKIAKTLKLSYSTVAKTIQRFNRTGSTQNRPRHGRPKKVEVHVLSVISRGCVWEIDVWVLPALLQRLKGWGGQPVSAQTIRRTLHQIGLHGCRPRRKPLLKMMHEKAANSLLKKSRLRTWITGTMSCGLMRLR